MKGELTINRIQSNVVDDCVRIQVGDSISGITFLELEISLADFARALTGLSNVNCDITRFHSANVGKRRETKVEEIRAAHFAMWTDAERDALIAQYEVDGWTCISKSAIGNQHQMTPNGYRVNFARWVETA